MRARQSAIKFGGSFSLALRCAEPTTHGSVAELDRRGIAVYPDSLVYGGGHLAIHLFLLSVQFDYLLNSSARHHVGRTSTAI